MLTEEQDAALLKIISFVSESDEKTLTLVGQAGTGKTFLTNIIVDKLIMNYRIAGVSPTHKAKKVLQRNINLNRLFPIKCMTVASLLSKLRQHSYTGTKKFVRGGSSKMEDYDLFIIDECSMITDEDVDSIIYFANLLKKKVLFIGDSAQIPNPSQKYTFEDNFIMKKDSKSFDLTTIKLTKIMRQSEFNPLVKYYTYLRNNLLVETEKPKTDLIKIDDITFGIKVCKTPEKFEKKIQKEFLNSDNTRVICYTNAAVNYYNKLVRKTLQREDMQRNDILMGYTNIGWPEPKLENGQDYIIKNVKEINDYMIFDNKEYSGLSGKLVEYHEPKSLKTNSIFLPDIHSNSNYEVLTELIKRANKVNKKNSTKEMYKKYKQLKDQLIFMESIYQYSGKMYTEKELKNNFPLLFKNVNEVICTDSDDDLDIIDNKLSKELREKFPNLLETRSDDNKSLTENELLCDRYLVFDCDLKYGYAITAHKSQASQWNTVLVDTHDFQKIKDTWNYYFNKKELRTKEKNQLLYVAFTRAVQKVVMY